MAKIREAHFTADRSWFMRNTVSHVYRDCAKTCGVMIGRCHEAKQGQVDTETILKDMAGCGPSGIEKSDSPRCREALLVVRRAFVSALLSVLRTDLVA